MNTREIKNSRILIVDDSSRNIQVVAGILKQGGYQMSYSLSGKAALSIIETETFDLFLLDIMMPEMNGYELSETLKKIPDVKDVPIIFLTAKTDTDSIVKGFESGGVDYITKPFNPTELLARVKTHLSLKHSKEALKEANLKLEQLNATKDKFFSIIAHDLRNPFQSLIMGTSMLLRYFDERDKTWVKKMLEKINITSQRASLLLENLLLWSRTQIGDITSNPEKIDLNGIVIENILLAEESALLKEIEITSTLGEKQFGYADREMINTVIRNLLTNAIKFTDKGGHIGISIDGHGDTIQISVTDTGVGIEEKNMAKLFKLDVKYITVGTGNERGTGLGLNICKEFIEKNGGKLWVKSEPGKGSTFYFTLPEAKAV